MNQNKLKFILGELNKKELLTEANLKDIFPRDKLIKQYEKIVDYSQKKFYQQISIKIRVKKE